METIQTMAGNSLRQFSVLRMGKKWEKSLLGHHASFFLSCGCSTCCFASGKNRPLPNKDKTRIIVRNRSNFLSFNINISKCLQIELRLLAHIRKKISSSCQVLFRQAFWHLVYKNNVHGRFFELYGWVVWYFNILIFYFL